MARLALPRTRLMLASLALLVACTAGQKMPADSLEYADYFDPACPEGCRDVDKYRTCGSVAATAYCVMAPDGNVTLVCNDGMMYLNHAGIPGCSQVAPPDPFAGMAFPLRTVYKFIYIFEHFYAAFDALGRSPPYIGVSVVESIIALYLLLFAARFEKITRVIGGAVVGELIAVLALAGFNVTLNHFVKGLPMWIFPVALGLVAAVWRRVMAFLGGFGLGFTAGCIACLETYGRTHRPIDKNVFFIVVAVTGFGVVTAQPIKKVILVLSVATLTALCGTAAVVQLAGPVILSAGCTTPADALGACPPYVVEAIFALFWAASIVTQMIGRRYALKARLRELHGEEEPLNDSRVSMSTRGSRAGRGAHGLYGTSV